MEEEGGFKENKSEKSFFHNGTVGQWKNILTPEQIEGIEAQTFDVMERLGYELSSMDNVNSGLG